MRRKAVILTILLMLAIAIIVPITDRAMAYDNEEKAKLKKDMNYVDLYLFGYQEVIENQRYPPGAPEYVRVW